MTYFDLFLGHILTYFGSLFDPFSGQNHPLSVCAEVPTHPCHLVGFRPIPPVVATSTTPVATNELIEDPL
jgi:hypothetical protein